MLSNKEIVCPDNLLKVAKKKKDVSVGIVNAGKPLPMHSAMEAVKENLIKPNLFVGNYNQRINKNIKTIKKLPKLKGVRKIYYPGENKYNRYKSNLKKSIVIPKNILEVLKKLNAIK